MAVATCTRESDPVDKLNLHWCHKVKGDEYLKLVSVLVDKHEHKCFTLKKPSGAVLRIAGLKDTSYSNKPDEVNGWGNFFLRDMVNMQVLGVVEDVSCPSEELVLMTCEDKRLYVYDGEELHVVASSLEDLKTEGIRYPSEVTFYNGQAFEDTTEEDWEEVKSGPVGRKLEQEHKKLVEANKSTFLKNLKSQK